MAASTASAAKAAILAAIAARPALATVKQSWGGPTQTEDVAEEHIYLGRAARDGGRPDPLGDLKRNESYLVAVHIMVLKHGDDEQATELRAFALLDEVSAALVADPFLANGGTRLLYLPAKIESWEQTNVPTPDQWGAQIVAQVRCEAMFIP